jgi:C4-dicarboxylate transporter DctM subunit
MVFFLLFVVFLVIGVPIAFSMGLSGLIFLMMNDVPLSAIAQKILTGVDSFTLLAIPLYVLAGEFMETGGISRRFMELASSLVGHIRGGLGHVVIVATMLLSGISGSSNADTAAIGSTMIPTMVRKGYSPEKATAIVAAAGGMDILIPPCITMIILGSVANISVANLFFAGLLSAVVMALCLMAVIYFDARKNNIAFEPWKGWGNVGKAFMNAFWALLIPIIILGGIRVGVFTATEGAFVAVVYSVIIAMFFYKEITTKDFFPVCVKAAKTSGTIIFLIGTASLFAWITAREQLPDLLLNWILSVSDSPVVFLLLVNVVLLFIGAVLEGSPAVIILTPLLMPVAHKFGIDPIHFGTIIIANIGVGFLLPPIGICLLVACSVGKVNVLDVSKPLMPYFIAMIVALLLITYIPSISLVIPVALGYQPVGF